MRTAGELRDLRFPLPPAIPHPAVQAAADKLAGYMQQLDDEHATWRHLVLARDDATASDRRALADAIAANKKDPGDRALATLEEKITASERRYEAVYLLAKDARRDLVDAIREHRDEMRASAAKQVEAARGELAAQLDELEARHRAWQGALAVADWTEKAPDNLKPTSVFQEVQPHAQVVYTTPMPVSWTTFIEAAREATDPDAPARPRKRPAAPMLTGMIG